MGTGSLGWAIVEKEGRDGVPVLKEHGIMVFPEGIDRDQTGEKPKNQQRTRSRASRRRYFRRKSRKQMLLAVLIREGLCPLGLEALDRWAKDDVYPDDPAFREWFKMQPYPLRAEALERPLSAHELGRVLYHMDQRRGFRSNRKEGDGEQKKFHAGDADRGIRGYDETQELLNQHGTMGKVAVHLSTQAKVEAVRRRFVKRDDYIKEFDLIWAKQRELHANDELGAKLTEQLHDEIGAPFDGIIFFQRPLRSQKGTVGKCRFEKQKRRAPQASLTAEVFEVLQTANNIKVGGQPLSMDLRDRVINELFLRKDRFTADDLNKALVKWKVEGASNYTGEEAKKVKFKGAEVIKDLAKLFGGKNWEPLAREIFNDPDRKEWLDRWAAIKDAEHFNEISNLREKGKDTGRKRDLKQYATENWGFDEKQLKALQKTAWPQGYANLSHKAMSKMIPWLRQGMIFSHAAFLANIDEAFGERWPQLTEAQRAQVAGDIQAIIESMRVEKGRTELLNGLVKQYRQHWDETKNPHGFWTETRHKVFDRAFGNWAEKELDDQLSDTDREALHTELIGRFDAHIDEYGVKAPFFRMERADERIANYLTEQWAISDEGLGKLYHPADIEIYPEARGEQLGSPFHPALNNPVALRALHALRFLINALLKSGAMDKDTRIRIELARELNSANERRAWQWFQSDMYDRQRKAEETCKAWFDAHMPGTPITADAIERVWLMQEAEEVLGQAKCVYTNRALSMADVIGSTANTDVEHTWPIWRSLDDSKANKTLCDRDYNRNTKHVRIPAECENWKTPKAYKGQEPAAILPNVEKFRERMEHFKMLVEIRKQDSKQAQDPDARNKAIVQKNYYNLWYRYWKAKYEHFALESIPLGFTNRQQVEVGLITRYARAYLRSFFPRVDCVKGELVSFMRKEWMGAKQEEKDRSNHFHHLVDAITMAATNKETTDRIAHDLREQDGRISEMTPTKPWPSFTEDVLNLKDKVLVYHYSEDPLGRTSRYKVKIKGKQRIATGSTVRGSIHKDTFYGRILWKDPQTGMKVLRTVKRMRIHDMEEKDVPFIVSQQLRDIIQSPEWAGIEKVKAAGGLPVTVRKGNTTSTHVVKKLRLFTQQLKRDKDGSPQPEETSLLEIKPHRDQVAGREHKHHLLAANDDNHFMGVYANTKGERSFHILTLFELTKALQRGEREGFPFALLPASIEREVRGKQVKYDLVKHNGRPLVLRKDQMVLLYMENPEEINWADKADISARLHKVRSFEPDGRLVLVHHMEAQPMSKLERKGSFVPGATGVRLRLSLNGLNALVEDVDFKCFPNKEVVPIDRAITLA